MELKAELIELTELKFHFQLESLVVSSLAVVVVDLLLFDCLHLHFHFFHCFYCMLFLFLACFVLLVSLLLV